MEEIKVKRDTFKTSIKIMSAIMLALFISLLPCFKGEVMATEVDASVPVIILEKYSVTNEQIVPGEEVTLTLFLKNCSETVNAYDVILDIANPEGVIPVYGTVSQVYIDKIAAGETKEVSVDYYAETSVDTTFLDFSLTVVVDSLASNYISLRVPAGMDVPFSVISANFPDNVVVGQNVTTNLTFVVLGDENVRNVAHTISVGDEVIGNSTIGTVTPGITRTQSTIVSFDEPGEYVVDIGIEYIDKTDQRQSYYIGSKSITVYESEEGSLYVPMDGADVKDEGMYKSLLLGLGGVSILVILIVVMLIRKKK